MPKTRGIFSQIITDWVNAGANTFTATTTAPTKGTTSVDNFWYRRNGGHLEVRIEYKQSAASASAGSGDYLLQAVPTGLGLTIDTTQVSTYTAVIGQGSTTTGNISPSNSVGSFIGSITTTQQTSGGVVVYDSTRVRFLFAYQGDATSATLEHGAVGSSTGLNSNNFTLCANFLVPIVGWSASD